MRVLRAGLGLIAARRVIICRAVAACNDLSRGGKCLLGNTQRVGTHIGNQTDRALAADFDALIQLLRDHHGLTRRHVQLPRSLLLQGRCDKRRRGVALLFGFFDTGNGKRALCNLAQNCVYLFLTAKLALFRVAVVARGKRTRLAHTRKRDVDCPVLLRHKGANFIFAVNHQSRCNRLHTACGKSLSYLFPQQRAELIADNAVKHTPRLLRIDEIQVNRARIFNRMAHDIARDFVKRHAHGLIVGKIEQIF